MHLSDFLCGYAYPRPPWATPPRFLGPSSARPTAEVRSQLYVAFDVGYLDKSLFEKLLAQAEEVGRIVGGLRASVARQRDQGRTE